ncbi:MAG: cobalamin-binding protein [Limnochordales bacterium]|nr:cobalamin-binding protein [Limnochordales bacterium]
MFARARWLSSFVRGLICVLLLLTQMSSAPVLVPAPAPMAATAATASLPIFRPVTLVDATGTKITITREPQRIITLAPSLTEMVYALGLGERVVGVSAWSDYPPEAAEKPVVGDAFALNREKILALKPDLILADQNLQPQAADDLRRLGLPVFVIAPKTLQEVLDAISTLGQLTGARQAAEHLVHTLQSRIEAVRSRTASLRVDQRPRVFVEIWNDPLMTAGPGSFIDELITLAGGVNVAAGMGQAWPQVNPEWVLARNPQVIILTLRNKSEVLARPGWNLLEAVRTGRVFEVVPDPLVRTGPRLVDGLEQLARLLHPELFGNDGRSR